MANTTTTRKDDKGVAGMAQDVKSTVQDVASNVADKARSVAGAVAEKAQNLGSAVGDRADSAVSSVGGGMQSLGHTIRERGPQEGVLGSAASTVGGALESSGRYLEEQGLSGIAEDLGNLIKRNPIPAMLLGVGLGFLLARVMTSSRS